MSGSTQIPGNEREAAAVFQRLLDLTAPEQQAELNRLPPPLALRVRSLLTHAERADEDDFMARPIGGRGFAVDALSAAVPSQIRQIGPYRVLELIGRGGMGSVYRALQDRPKRTVALKLLRPDLLDDAAYRRFLEETEMLGSLNHPGIAQVYSAGEHDGLPYFAMEYVRHASPITGYAMAEALSIKDRLTLFCEVCHAVEFGHDHGIVHRDLKPSNILVGEDGRPTVIDFGIARAMLGQTGVTTETMHQAFGTLAYACPEQLEGRCRIPDVRGDVYSLGVVLYELLTDRRAFDLSESSYVDAIRAIQRTDVPRPSSVVPPLRGDLEAIIQTSMAPDPKRRYQHVAALRGDLQNVLARRPVSARAPSRWYRLRRLAQRHPLSAFLVCALAVLLVLGGVGGTALGLHATNQAHQRSISARRANLAAAYQALLRNDTAQANAFLTEVPESYRGAAWRMLDQIVNTPIQTLVTDSMVTEARPDSGASVLLLGGLTPLHFDPQTGAGSRLDPPRAPELSPAARWLDLSEDRRTTVTFDPVSQQLGLCTHLGVADPRFVELRRMTIEPDLVRLSPDGSQLWLQASLGDPIELISTADASLVGTWPSMRPAATTRDGSRAAGVNRNGAVFLLDPAGNMVVTAAHVANGETLRDLSSDGDEVLIAGPNGHHLVSTVDGKTVVTVNAPAANASALGPLPGQMAVADGHSLKVIGSTLGDILTLRGPESPAMGIWFDPSGNLLTASTADAVHAWALDDLILSTAALGGAPRTSWVAPWSAAMAFRGGRAVEIPALSAPTSAQATSPDGRLIARADRLNQLWITDLDHPQRADRRLDLGSRCSHLVFMSDRHVAAIEATADSVTTVTLLDAERGSVERSVRLDGPCHAAAASHDGSLLLGVGPRVVQLDLSLQETAVFTPPDGDLVTAIATTSPGLGPLAVITDWTTLWTIDGPAGRWRARSIGASRRNPLHRCAWVSESEIVVGRNSSVTVYDLSESPPALTFDGDLAVLGMRALRMPKAVWQAGE